MAVAAKAKVDDGEIVMIDAGYSFWVTGSGDQAMLESVDGAMACLPPALPGEIMDRIPTYVAPDYDVRYVPTARAAAETE